MAAQTSVDVPVREEMPSRHPRRAWPRLVVLMAIGVLCALPGLAYLGGHLEHGIVADADFLLLHELIPDLVRGGSLHDWDIPYATYMVPDWPLYGLALVIGPTAATTVALFSWFQLLLLAVAIAVIGRELDRVHWWIGVASAMSLIVLAVVGGAIPVVYLAASYVHGGTAVAAVAMLGLVLAWVRAPRTGVVIISALLSFALVASDRLFVLWALVPATVALTVLVVTRLAPLRPQLQWLGVHLLAAVAGLPVADLLFPERSRYELSLGWDFDGGQRRFRESLELVVNENPWLIWLTIGCLGLIIIMTVTGRSLVGSSIPMTQRLVIVSFLAVNVAGISLSQIALIGEVPPHVRYSIPIFVLPLILAPLMGTVGLGARLASRSGRWADEADVAITMVSLTGLAMLLISSVIGWVERIDPDRVFRPIACVQDVLGEGGSHYGISSYWDARPFQIESDGAFVMSEYAPDLTPMGANSNRAELMDAYDFAIVSSQFGHQSLIDEQLLLIADTPQQLVECGPWRIYDYGPGGLRLDPFAEPGDERYVPACLMQSHNGQEGPDCEVIVPLGAPRAYAIAGPYLPAPPGQYRFRVKYSSDMGRDEIIGPWDIVAGEGGTRTVAGGDLLGTGGAGRIFEREVRIDAIDEADIYLQWRLITEEGSSVTIESVTIERIR